MNLGTEALMGKNAARQYNIAGTSKNRSAQRLSSGYRISEKNAQTDSGVR